MKYFFSIFLLISSLLVFGESKISPNDNKIVIEGAMHLKYNDGKMIIDRFSDQLWGRENLNNFSQPKAKTQSGVRVIFKTDSKTVRPIFSDREGADLRKATNFYGIYKNGKFNGVMSGDNLILESSEQGVVEWEIVLPIYYGVNFEGLTIDDGAKMFKVDRGSRPIFIAIGDSITHGAGQTQCGSDGSYPFVLAQTNGYYLYNLAVGGSQISPAIAQELTGIKADIITILWGFNDWNGTKGDITEITKRYELLLSEVRKVQPTAKIYCIMPTTAADESGKNGKNGKIPGKPLSTVRDAERQVAETIAKRDKNLFIIEGNKISTPDDLNGSVHFNNEGARRFGEALAKQIN